MSIKKLTAIKPAPVERPAKASTVPQQSSKLLFLSIDDISFENEIKNDDMFSNEHRHTEKNSALFNALKKKPTEHSLNFSGKLLTDKDADESIDLLKLVNGIQINVQGTFN
ncbi:MAG: hypothetical protein LJE83_04395 [Gammaproteobacteria bacterium]|nr:hypothetical protein [Gammaproteobacteria bacterium]